MKIWIDTDIGSDVDDALALAYVLRHPDMELVGISTVFGDVELRTRIAEALLGIAEAPDVPLVTGLGLPLTDKKPGVMFGHEGRGLLTDPEPEPRLRIRSEAGVESRVETLAAGLADAAPDVVLAIGPLTNVGALVRAGVTLPPLAIMGGKVENVLLEGMVEAIPEWNWFCDPLAVQLVIEAEHDVAPLLVPAEVTFQTRLADGDVELLAAGDPLTVSLASLCEGWLQAQRDLFDRDEPRVALHDPLTAAVLVEPDLCPLQPRSIAVGSRGETTIVDEAPNVSVAVDVDPRAARDHMMSILLR